MYLHIGDECVIELREVIAILDVHTLSCSSEGAHFLSVAKEQAQLINVGAEKIKAYVVTEGGVYASPISAATLKRRASNPQAMLDWA